MSKSKEVIVEQPSTPSNDSIPMDNTVNEQTDIINVEIKDQDFSLEISRPKRTGLKEKSMMDGLHYQASLKFSGTSLNNKQYFELRRITSDFSKTYE
jgi:hypothetical protein